MDRGRRKEDSHEVRRTPWSLREFERALKEEVAVSADFDLPLSVLVTRTQHRWTPENMRHIVGALRKGDLITRTEPEEIAIALPNTEAGDAKVVEHRLRKALPEAAIGIASQEAGDTFTGLLYRARAAANRETLY